MEALKAFWMERAPREKAVLSVLALVVAAALVFLILVEPALTGIARLERGLPQSRAQAAQLEALLSEVKSLKARAQVATVSAQEARGAIEKSLAAAGLKAARIVPLSDGDIQLTFANVPFATWARWLATTESELGARTTSVVVNGQATVGNVDVELALRLARK